ncbi:Transcription initiation factor IIA small chain (TFIIA 13.5 kDa subunit) [Nowakowskiella sp. JEL0078]|nr:Transcription initiation factor IIA small chain (TFIIA 13.5 kDa subunit) [Nowakowskiella sp. JEL0078]
MKEKTSKKGVARRHDPLHVQHQRDSTVEIDASRKAARLKPALSKHADASDNDDAMEDVIDPKSSKKILDLVRLQQDDISSELSSSTKFTDFAALQTHVFPHNDSDDDDEMDDDDLEYEDVDFGDVGLGIDAADAALVDKFLNSEPRKQLNLSNLIMDKINESERLGFDSSVSEALQSVRNRSTIKSTRLTTYRFCDDVWTFIARDPIIKIDQEVIHADKVKIVACNAAKT